MEKLRLSKEVLFKTVKFNDPSSIPVIEWYVWEYNERFFLRLCVSSNDPIISTIHTKFKNGLPIIKQRKVEAFLMCSSEQKHLQYTRGITGDFVTSLTRRPVSQTKRRLELIIPCVLLINRDKHYVLKVSVQLIILLSYKKREYSVLK